MKPAKYGTILVIGFLWSITPFDLEASGSGSGGGAIPDTGASARARTPKEKAIKDYQNGLKKRDKAWQYEEKAKNARNEKDRIKNSEKAQKEFRNAIKKYRSAIDKVPDFYQAHTSLGYALRRVGDYDESIKAYDTALSIAPGYAEALEYRGEAYLGLNRLEDAKESYMVLFRGQSSEADKLLTAIKEWAAAKNDKADADPAMISNLTEWISEREKIAERLSARRSGNGGW